MTNNETIEAIRRLPDDHQVKLMNDDGFYQSTDITTDDLKALADSVPRWIPCEERLPERAGDYLVAFHGGFVQEAFFEAKWMTWMKHKIIAWMPLPEPYKPE